MQIATHNVGYDATRKSHFLIQKVGVNTKSIVQHIHTQSNNYLSVVIYFCMSLYGFSLPEKKWQSLAG